MTVDELAGWTLLAYVAVAVLVVVLRAVGAPQGWRLWMLYSVGTLYARICFRWQANGPCPFLDKGPVILIGNHRSPVDPLFIWAGVTNCRPLEFLTAREYFGVPGLSYIFKNLHAIPVARDGKDMAATREALRRLKERRIVGVFPEGGINTDPGSNLRLPNPGVAFLALHSRAPVYPVFVENAPRGKGMVDPFWNFTRVRTLYGEQIDLSAYYGRRMTPELLNEVTDLLMGKLAELGGVTAAKLSASSAGPDVVPFANQTA